MVAPNPAYALSKPTADAKNRVGRFFSLAAESVRADRCSTRNRTGEKRGYGYDTTSVDTEFEYGAFGELIRATGEKKDDFSFRFSTKYEDVETKLLYYGYRYYNAETGRFINPDPIKELGGLNLYVFALNGAINGDDVLGLCPLPNPPSSLEGLDRVAVGIEDIIEYFDFKLEKTNQDSWSWKDGTIAEGLSNSPEERQSLLGHEVVAGFLGRHGIHESNLINPNFTPTQPLPNAPHGVLASGTHNLAMAFELSKLAELDQTQCSCDYARERFKTAHLPSNQGDTILFANKLTTLVDFICGCQSGQKNQGIHETFDQKIGSIFDKEAIRIEYKLECNEGKIKACTSIALYD